MNVVLMGADAEVMAVKDGCRDAIFAKAKATQQAFPEHRATVMASGPGSAVGVTVNGDEKPFWFAFIGQHAQQMAANLTKRLEDRAEGQTEYSALTMTTRESN